MDINCYRVRRIQFQSPVLTQIVMLSAIYWRKLDPQPLLVNSEESCILDRLEGVGSNGIGLEADGWGDSVVIHDTIRGIDECVFLVETKISGAHIGPGFFK